jgi:hypothetical protein
VHVGGNGLFGLGKRWHVIDDHVVPLERRGQRPGHLRFILDEQNPHDPHLSLNRGVVAAVSLRQHYGNRGRSGPASHAPDAAGGIGQGRRHRHGQPL